MILQQVMMQMSKPGKSVPKLVMLSKYGLAVHKGEEAYSHTWVISHFNSGKSVLRYIKERKDVDRYLEKLIEILPAWTFTLEEFDKGTIIDRPRVKLGVDALQQEILKKEF